MTQEKVKKPASYDEVVIGEEISRQWQCTPHWCRAFRFATEDDSILYDPLRNPNAFVPPAAIVSELMVLFLQEYDHAKTTVIHQRQEIWCVKPVPVGTTLKFSGRFTSKYVKREKGQVVFDGEAYDEKGDVVVRQRSVNMMPVALGTVTAEGMREVPSFRVEGAWPENAPLVEKASADIAIPSRLPLMTKVARQDQIAVFSGIAQHRYNIHTSLEKARSVGFERCVLAGMQETCWQMEFATKFFGEDFLYNGHILSAYTTPVLTDDVLTGYGVVVGKEKDGADTRLNLEFWLENQDRKKTAVGSIAARAR